VVPDVFETLSWKVYFYQTDQLGSTQFVTDDRGLAWQHLEYFPSGETWVDERSEKQRTPWQFSGKEMDEETGLNYFGFRYYDARQSQWINPDPILDELLDTRKLARSDLSDGAFHLPGLVYGYAGNSPTNLIDPNGLMKRAASDEGAPDAKRSRPASSPAPASAAAEVFPAGPAPAAPALPDDFVGRSRRAAVAIRENLRRRHNVEDHERNVAIVEMAIEGEDRRREYRGLSGDSIRYGTPLLPEKERRYRTGEGHTDSHTEVKLLERVARDLTPESRGILRLYSERPICSTCNPQINRFRRDFPHIQVETYDN